LSRAPDDTRGAERVPAEDVPRRRPPEPDRFRELDGGGLDGFRRQSLCRHRRRPGDPRPGQPHRALRLVRQRVRLQPPGRALPRGAGGRRDAELPEAGTHGVTSAYFPPSLKPFWAPSTMAKGPTGQPKQSTISWLTSAWVAVPSSTTRAASRSIAA